MLWPLCENFVELASSDSRHPAPHGFLRTRGLLAAGLGQMCRIPLVLTGSSESAESRLLSVPCGVIVAVQQRTDLGWTVNKTFKH